MTTAQNVLGNFKSDIDILKKLGNEIVTNHTTRYELYSNGTRPNYFSILKDRCSTLINIAALVKSNKELRKEDVYVSMVDAYASLIDDYNEFILTTEMGDGEDKLHAVKLFNTAKDYILDIGNDILNALYDYDEVDRYVNKVEDLIDQVGDLITSVVVK